MLDEAIELGAEAGAHEVVIGMAHRGRLNALVHTVGRSYVSVLREFEGERSFDALVVDPEGGSGDVKYHLPASGTRLTAAGEIEVTIAPNPSHLEAVDPVVEGWTRAEQTDRSAGAGLHDPTVALPVLIHGDAAFAGQGVVAETLNLQSLEGYSTGGTLHVITNNQVGFTTSPTESRSTRYSSDLAKGFDIPIVHVNADDPEAALSAVRLALAYRAEFGHDFVIDLVGYRRHGHNEQDEAAYTQPLMAERIQAQPTVRAQYAARLVEEGILTAEEADRIVEELVATLREAHDRLRASIAEPPAPPPEPMPTTGTGEAVETAVPADRLRALNEQLLRVPRGFTVNPKLARQLERRRETIEQGGIDWGQAEALAFASLLEDGIPIRLSGQDTERGTFSHRHLVLHDPLTDETATPIQHLPGAHASFEVYNSPLSEFAALGFEYGYSIAAPDALVLWEAQFGDFVNGAQMVIDQFIVAGRSKWKQYLAADAAPSARVRGQRAGALERAARTVPAARRAGEHPRRELHDGGTVLPSAPSAGARRRRPAARRDDAEGAAAPQAGVVLARPSTRVAASSRCSTTSGPIHEAVERLVLCSGKLYYDIVGHDLRARRASGVAVARLEQLYPFPVARRGVARGLSAAPRGRLGAGGAPEHGGLAVDPPPARGDGPGSPAESVRYVGRTWKASPSEGYPTAHHREQDRIVRVALGAEDG